MMIEGFEFPSSVKINDEEIKYLKLILKMKPQKNWTQNDVLQAIYLARTQVQIERLNNILLEQGDMYEVKGKLVMRPEHDLIDKLTKRVATLSRIIQIHAVATQGRARDSIGATELKEIEAERAMQTYAPLPPPSKK